MQTRVSLGIDTSCYTTSVACADHKSIVFEKRTMLSVPFGNRGLRQSEGLYQHIRQLSPLLCDLFEAVDPQRIGAIAVSASPTAREDSYGAQSTAVSRRSSKRAYPCSAVRKRKAARLRPVFNGTCQRRNDRRFVGGATSERGIPDRSDRNLDRPARGTVCRPRRRRAEPTVSGRQAP